MRLRRWQDGMAYLRCELGPFTILLSSQDPCIYAQDAVGHGDIWLSQTDLLIQSESILLCDCASYKLNVILRWMLDTSCFWMNNAVFALKCVYCTPYHSLANSSFCFTASIWIRISKAQPKAGARVVLHPSPNNKNKAVSLSPIIIIPTIPLHLIILSSPPPCLLCPPFCISNSFFSCYPPWTAPPQQTQTSACTFSPQGQPLS